VRDIEMTVGRRGQGGSSARGGRDDGWSGLRTREGKQESFGLYIFIHFILELRPRKRSVEVT
jgi:hypothetical protein